MDILANSRDLARFLTHRPSSFVFAVFLVEQCGKERSFELVGAGPEFRLVIRGRQFCRVWTFMVVDKSAHLKKRASIVDGGVCDIEGPWPDPVFPLRVKRYYVETSRLFLLFVVLFRINTDVAREVAQFLGDGAQPHWDLC